MVRMDKSTNQQRLNFASHGLSHLYNIICILMFSDVYGSYVSRNSGEG